MSLHPDVEKRIQASPFNELLGMYQALADGTKTLIIPFYDENTNPEPGDHVAEIHLVVRQIARVG